MRFSDEFRANLQSLFAWRRDVRRFRRTALPEGTLDRLIATACLAPSVGLSQPWRFVIVEDAARRQAVRENFRTCNAAALAEYGPDRAARYAALKLAGLEDAPVHLAIFADRGTGTGGGLGRRTMPEMIDYSAVLAAHTLWLAARADGIGMGWVSILDPAALSAALAIPPDWRLIGYFCLGYPEDESETPELQRAGWEDRKAPQDLLLRR